MVRINLLPREVVEKRLFERRVKYVVAGGMTVLLLLGAVYGVLAFQVSQRNADLQDRQQTEANLRAQAESFAIFEQKEAELESRLEVARQALAGRVSWGRFANEFSLVLPSDVWLVSLTGDEETGVTAVSRAVDSPTDSPDLGHKAVARTLVRMADLEQLYNVWLASSVKTEYEEQPVIDFSVSASVHPDDADDGTADVPADGQ